MLVASPTRCLARVLAVLPLAVAVACSDSPVAPRPTTPAKPLLLAAPVVTVTNTDDAGPGSLRQAIIDAASGSVIQFDAAIAGQTVVLTTGYIMIDNKALTIEGPVPAGMSVSGGLTSRVFVVIPGADLTLRNLSIVDGRDDFGGAIATGGKLLLDHSLVANNQVLQSGGGVWSTPTGDVTILNSTISGNSAGFVGGGIESQGSLTIRNATIADNTGYDTGGLHASSGAVALRNVIVANNVSSAIPGSANCDFDAGVVTLFTGRNVANGECSVSPSITNVTPQLGPLADNGGPTKTYALLNGSPIIDAGILCTEATDQRYVARSQGSTCDVGAYEFDDYGQVALTIGPNVAMSSKTGVVTVTGTIACSRPTSTSLNVTLSQTQTLTGRFTTIVQGSATTATLSCDAAPSSWSVTVTAAAGKFKNGSATGRVTATGLPTDFLPADVTAPVKIFIVK